MPFGQTASGIVYAQPFPGPGPNTVLPTVFPATSSAFVPSGTSLPGQNPAQGLTQNLQETVAQYAALLPTISTAAPASTDFILTLPGGATFDVTTFWSQYWWIVALGATVLFWPKGKGRR